MEEITFISLTENNIPNSERTANLELDIYKYGLLLNLIKPIEMLVTEVEVLKKYKQ